MAFLFFRIRWLPAVKGIIGSAVIIEVENLAGRIVIIFSSALWRLRRINDGFLLGLRRSRFINDDLIFRRDGTLKKRGVFNRLLFGGTLLALIL